MAQKEDERYINEMIYQQRIAAAVRQRLAGDEQPVSDRLAELLGISRGVAYKRLQNKAFFTAREMSILQARLDIVVSPEVNDREPLLTFRAPLRLTGDRYDATQYLDLIQKAKHQLESIQEQGGDVSVQVSSSDLPIFYFFKRPVLAAVKLYSFALTASRESSNIFDLDRYLDINQNALATASNYADEFFKLNAIEVWSRTPVDNFLRQVISLAQMGILSDLDALNRICQELSGVLGELQVSLEKGARSSGSSLSCFCNDKHYTNSVILVKHKLQSALYVTFDNPHFITSQQAGATNYFNDYFELLLRVSDPISRLGQLSAHRFINEQRTRIARAQKKASLLIEAASNTLDLN